MKPQAFNGFQLTPANYHSVGANQVYMSRSQYEDFLACEAMAMATIRGEYVQEETDALLAGQMLHAWNEGPEALQEFYAINRSKICTKTTGDLKAPFKVVQAMIDCLRMDAFAMWVLQGQKEVILTAELFGVPWKIRLDSYNPDQRRFAELKSTKGIWGLSWSTEHEAKVSFVEAWYYPRQAAIYAEIERLAAGRAPGDYLEPIMVAVSKEDPPDKEIISLMDPERFAIELREVERHMLRIIAVKHGGAEPKRCGRCEYCRSLKTLTRIVHYTELMEG